MGRTSRLLTQSFNSEEAGAGSRHFVSALARGLQILALFDRDTLELGNDEISRRTGLPRSTVTRMTYTLVTLRYLVYVPRTHGYRLGVAAMSWSHAAQREFEGVAFVQPFMQEFANQLKASTVAFSANMGLEMVYVAHCAGPSLFSIRTSVGTRLKVWESSAGRTYWASADEASRSQLRGALTVLSTGMQAHAERMLEQADAEYAQHGFCTSLGGWREGVNAAGCPVRWNRAGKVETFVVSCGGTAGEFSEDMIYASLGPRLREFVKFLEPKLQAEELA
jgi:DNA-binding IclR family transcriptional regulator